VRAKEVWSTSKISKSRKIAHYGGRNISNREIGGQQVGRLREIRRARQENGRDIYMGNKDSYPSQREKVRGGIYNMVWGPERQHKQECAISSGALSQGGQNKKRGALLEESRTQGVLRKCYRGCLNGIRGLYYQSRARNVQRQIR